MKITSACLVMSLFGTMAGLSPLALGQEDPPPPEVDAPKTAGFYIPPPPPTTDQLRAKLNGLSLPAGFQHSPEPIGSDGEVGGVITGPRKLEIYYFVLPTGQYRLAPGQVYFSSEALRLKEGQHQWSREQYIGDELVQLTLATDNTLAVSYPGRGVNMMCDVNGLVTLSIPNKDRRVSWDKARKLIERGDVKSVTQLHSGKVFIRLADETEYQTQEPNIDDVIKLIRALGKDDAISIATE